MLSRLAEHLSDAANPPRLSADSPARRRPSRSLSPLKKGTSSAAHNLSRLSTETGSRRAVPMTSDSRLLATEKSATPLMAFTARDDTREPAQAISPPPSSNAASRLAAPISPEPTLLPKSVSLRANPQFITAAPGGTSTPPRLVGADFGGGMALPAMWVAAAAARRELGNPDTDDPVDTPTGRVDTSQPASPQPAMAMMNTAADSTTTSTPLNADGSRVLVTTVDGDSSTGFTTQFSVTDSTGATIGEPVHLAGAPSSTQVSADGSHVLVSTVDYDSTVGSTTSVALIDITSGTQTGSTFVLTGDAASSPPQLLNDAGTAVLVTTAVNDSRTSTWATWATVLDFTADMRVGTTVVVPGYPAGATLVTDDGSRAVITTFVDNWETGSTSTRVAVVNTTTGTQAGETLALTGRPSSSELSGGNARITTDAGLQATIDTATGNSATVPVAFPWGFDIPAFLNTPIGQVAGGILVSAYFVGSVFVAYFVIAPVIVVYDAVATVLGLPTFTEWQLRAVASSAV